MDLRVKNIVDAHLSTEPEIGRWLWAIQDARQRTMEELARLLPAMIDWLPGGDESSIGTVLYHMTDIEADWLYVEVLEQSLPPAVAALFPHPTRDERGQLTQVQGYSLEDHLQRLATIRGLLLAAYQ
jgi:uncharacterized damage-inducible protein DinB